MALTLRRIDLGFGHQDVPQVGGKAEGAYTPDTRPEGTGGTRQE